MSIPLPTAANIWQARAAAKLSVREAGELVYVDPTTWLEFEAGTRAIPMASWELFLMKTLQAPIPVAVTPPKEFRLHVWPVLR